MLHISVSRARVSEQSLHYSQSQPEQGALKARKESFIPNVNLASSTKVMSSREEYPQCAIPLVVQAFLQKTSLRFTSYFIHMLRYV